ncbi:MAG TPA: alginate lyase family protein [Tepidisphaeraceae bacterium]|jgi:hypothetical protein
MKLLPIPLLLMSLLCLPSLGAQLPRVYQSDPQAMATNRERARGNDPALAPALAVLRKEADRALTAGPYSVTRKKHASLTGDPRDYISLAPYFWPNPDTKDGLPYVRHDGRRNPEIHEYDAANFSSMSGHVHTLALAYYLLGDEACADRAALLIRAWFLDPATRMNPNLQHAQLVRGVNDGRGTGIIESARFLPVIDAIGLLHGSRAWTEQDQQGMQAWFRDYVKWMRDSHNGRDEAAARNNHGTWYDVQLVTYLLFLGDESEARKVAEEAKSRRIASQIQPDGSLPLEQARATSLSYTVFDLRAFTELADLARRVDVELWNYQTSDGRGIRKAIDYTLPYVVGEKPWEHSQISPFNNDGFIEPLRRATLAYDDPKYREAMAKLEGKRGITLNDLRTPLGVKRDEKAQ